LPVSSVRAHQFIAKGLYWRERSAAKKQLGQAESNLMSVKKRITIRVDGTGRAGRELLRRIRDQFEYVHQSAF